MLFAMGSRSTVSYLITRQSNTLVLNCGEIPETTDTGNSKYGYMEDIYFFEVNTKYISSNVLKISVISRVRSTSENVDIFST